MCGIVGYIGNKNVEAELLSSLKLLEYRGYDSAGLAVLTKGTIQVTKAEGKISNLESCVTDSGAHMGIAHTRWATHGKPTKQNAHPHTSENGNWAVVHNGIIENFEELKTTLSKDYKFVSETDTEIVAHMLQDFDTGNNKQTIVNCCSKLQGSYALLIINKNDPKTLFLAKKKSPLYISCSRNEILVASDPICFVNKTKEYYALQDDEFCSARLGKVEFFDSKMQKVCKQTTKLSGVEVEISKKDYPHYMIKEIDETPVVLKRIADVYKEDEVFKKLDKQLLKSINKIYLIGCGTAYHAGIVGAKFIEQFARLEARCFMASEFRYSNPIIDNKTLSIFVSQSGETADTIMAHEIAKQKGAKTVALTNVLYSTLAQKVDYIFPVCAGVEIAVASTKAYTAQITILNMFAKYLCNVLKLCNYDYIRDINKLVLAINHSVNVDKLADNLAKKNDMFFIGRNYDYITCMEASLKLKEITYINSQAYAAGELKHGFLALVDKDTYVIALATEKALLSKTLNGAYEAVARGAQITMFTPFDIENLNKDFNIVKIPLLSEDLMPICSVVWFQKLSYLTSVKKGLNPDQPRNLAKSVTVE